VRKRHKVGTGSESSLLAFLGLSEQVLTSLLSIEVRNWQSLLTQSFHNLLDSVVPWEPRVDSVRASPDFAPSFSSEAGSVLLIPTSRFE
jgi:hypothetical protein